MYACVRTGSDPGGVALRVCAFTGERGADSLRPAWRVATAVESLPALQPDHFAGLFDMLDSVDSGSLTSALLGSRLTDVDVFRFTVIRRGLDSVARDQVRQCLRCVVLRLFDRQIPRSSDAVTTMSVSAEYTDDQLVDRHWQPVPFHSPGLVSSTPYILALLPRLQYVQRNPNISAGMDSACGSREGPCQALRGSCTLQRSCEFSLSLTAGPLVADLQPVPEPGTLALLGNWRAGRSSCEGAKKKHRVVTVTASGRIAPLQRPARFFPRNL